MVICGSEEKNFNIPPLGHPAVALTSLATIMAPSNLYTNTNYWCIFCMTVVKVITTNEVAFPYLHIFG
jgi:hypothetical protein